jgi:hypothetical protein
MLSECEEATVVIGSAQESGTEKNPLPYFTRKKMIQNVYRSKEEYSRLRIIGVKDVINTSWQNYGLFKELYEGNLEEYTFVTNIICVDFTDGTMVGHYLFLLDDFYYDKNGIIHYKDQNSDKKRYYYYDDNGRKRYTDKKSSNQNKEETSASNDSISADDNHAGSNGSDTLLDLVKKYAGSDAILPDNYCSVGYYDPNGGWYSDADEKYHYAYYILLKVDEKNKNTFIDDFINKLKDNGYVFRYKEYNYEYVKNNIVICFSNVLESRVDGQLEYYYVNYYVYTLD